LNSEILTFGDPRRPQYVSALDLSSLFGAPPADPASQRLAAALMQREGVSGSRPAAPPPPPPSAAPNVPLPPVRPQDLGVAPTSGVSPMPQPSDGPSPASAVTSSLPGSGGDHYRPGFDPDQAAPDPGAAMFTRAASTPTPLPAATPSQADLLARAATIPTALPPTGQPSPQPVLARANPFAGLIPSAQAASTNSPDLLARAAAIPTALPASSTSGAPTTAAAPQQAASGGWRSAPLADVLRTRGRFPGKPLSQRAHSTPAR
jgi:hypothetical protein